jgi:hypothetical protein
MCDGNEPPLDTLPINTQSTIAMLMVNCLVTLTTASPKHPGYDVPKGAFAVQKALHVIRIEIDRASRS